MKIIVCVDNQNGMMFNHRRQSQDRVLRKRILELTGGKKVIRIYGVPDNPGRFRQMKRFWKRRGRESTVLSRTRMLFRMRAGSKK